MNRIKVSSDEMLEMITTYYDTEDASEIYCHVVENGFVFNEFTLIWEDMYTYKVKIEETKDDGYMLHVKKIWELKDHTHKNKKFDFKLIDYLENLTDAMEELRKKGKSAVQMMNTDFIDRIWAADVLPVMAFIQYVVYNAMHREVVEVEATQKKYKPISERNYKPNNNKVYKLIDVVRKYEKHINHSVRHVTCDYWEVKGHFRHYKNGKVTYVKPYSKGKNKEGRSIDREYKL